MSKKTKIVFVALGSVCVACGVLAWGLCEFSSLMDEWEQRQYHAYEHYPR